MVSQAELAAIGGALLGAVSATIRAGHSTPAETLDYVSMLDTLGPDDSAAPVIVRDFIAWTGRRQDLVPGAEARLRRLVQESGTLDALVDDLARLRTPRAALSARITT